MRFIRKGGRIIPINDKAARVVKGAAKDAIVAGAMTTALTVAMHKAPLKFAAKQGLIYGGIWGAVSGGIRAAGAINRSLHKKKTV